MVPNTPNIRVADALDAFGGVQARLAAALGLSRATVNEWVKSGRECLPELQSYRLAALKPDLALPGVGEIHPTGTVNTNQPGCVRLTVPPSEGSEAAA